MSQEYRPVDRVETGTRLEKLVSEEYRKVEKKYERITGKKCSQFIPNGGNKEGFDANIVSDDHITSIELKNLQDYYQVPGDWVQHNFFDKELRNPYRSDILYLIVTGGNLAPSAIKLLASDPRVIVRHLNGMHISSDEDLKNKKLIQRIRACCWELCEMLNGKVPSVYLLQHYTIPYIHTISSIFYSFHSFFTQNLYTVNYDPPPVNFNFAQKIKSALVDIVKPPTRSKRRSLRYQVDTNDLGYSHSQ